MISLAHSGGVAVAISSDPGACHGIGIDLESLDRLDEHREAIQELALTDSERALLRGLQGDTHDDWLLRLWCAKEAVGKALGRGMLGGPGSLLVREVNLETGTVTVTPGEIWASELPEIVPAQMAAHTAREGRLVVAVALLRPLRELDSPRMHVP